LSWWNPSVDEKKHDLIPKFWRCVRRDSNNRGSWVIREEPTSPYSAPSWDFPSWPTAMSFTLQCHCGRGITRNKESASHFWVKHINDCRVALP
jgi:hypothetical protein